MRNYKQLLLLLIPILMMGCKADLRNLDTTAGIKTGLSIPIGNIHFTMADLMNADNVNNVIVDENGLFHIVDTAKLPYKEFHPIDLTNYLILTEGGRNFKVMDQVSSLCPGGVIMGDGHTVIPLEFEMGLQIHGFNQDPDDERIDSMQVSLASFSSLVDITDFPLEWNDIQSIQLILSEQVTRPQGNTVSIYDKARDAGHGGFGQNIPIDVDNFTICLLKDRTQPVTCNHTVESLDSVGLKIRFNLCIPSGRTITINPQSAFHYDLNINLIAYKAIWGFFKESSQMVDKDAIKMDELWSGWSDIQKMKMKFAEPSLFMYLTHHIGAPLKAHVDYMYTVGNGGQRIYAKNGNQTAWDIPLENVLDPATTQIQDSIQDFLTFSYKDDEGQIDELFKNNPDSFCYSYHVMADNDRMCEYPQHRITDNYSFNSFSVLDLPFSFDEGTEFNHIQYLDSINLSALSLDSLLKAANIKLNTTRNDLTFYVKTENFVPFALDIVMECLAEDSSVLDVHLFDDDMIHVDAPAQIVNGLVLEASHSTATHTIHKSEFERLAQVKYIRMKTILRNNPAKARLFNTTKFTMFLGITADVEGTITY